MKRKIGEGGHFSMLKKVAIYPWYVAYQTPKGFETI
jgi:hypothetical protein